MNEDRWPRIAVVGAGAVGCYFGGLLARAGAPVVLIGRETHVRAIRQDGLLLDTLRFREYVQVEASVDLTSIDGADLVLFCVKTLDTEDVAKAIAPLLNPGAVVVSLQNGVDNVDRIRNAAGIDAIPAVVYVAAAMSGPGQLKHSGRGDLVIGGSGAARLEPVAGVFARAAIPCRVSPDIGRELWTKMILNCAYNAISALGRAKYGSVLKNSWTRDVMHQLTVEAVAVAHASGVDLEEPEVLDQVWKIGDAMAGATSSTAQDLMRGKRTEIDSLNGYVVRRGAELGVSTPINQTLHALVKLLEESVVA